MGFFQKIFGSNKKEETESQEQEDQIIKLINNEDQNIAIENVPIYIPENLVDFLAKKITNYGKDDLNYESLSLLHKDTLYLTLHNKEILFKNYRGYPSLFRLYIDEMNILEKIGLLEKGYKKEGPHKVLLHNKLYVDFILIILDIEYILKTNPDILENDPIYQYNKDVINDKVKFYNNLIKKDEKVNLNKRIQSQKDRIKLEILTKKEQREVREIAKKELEIEGFIESKKRREPIPQEIQDIVWNRDGGKCVKCGSQENLEFDHIIPFSKGGSNTARNLQLLCQKCNREKSNKIG